MTLRLQIIILVCMLLAVLWILNLMRKKKMDFRYALGWLCIIACISILTIWPVLLNKIAALFGIVSPMNMLFFFGFCFAVVVIFSLSITISHLTDRVKKLAQEIAIMRKDMYDRCNSNPKD